MTEYRVYIIGSDGHFKSAVPLECKDDEAAKVQAEQLVGSHDVELWQRARKVATFAHEPLDAAKNGQGGTGAAT